MTDYKTQLREGGVKSLLIKLDIYERIEDYEACAEIKRVIDDHNQEATVKLPTRLPKEQIYALK
jgi:hypothetical protein